jgi:hypothetical protein
MIRPGVTLDPPAVGLGSQTVVAVNWPDGPTGEMEVVTTLTTYRFKTNENIQLPRRSDGSIIDWRTQSRIPTMREVFAGDILPSPLNPAPEKDTVSWGLWMQNDYAVVTRIYHALSPLDEYMLCLFAAGTQSPMRFKFHIDDYLIFPRPQATVPQSRTLEMTESGVYRDEEYEGVTYSFLLHPHGRGRWPSHIPEYERMAKPGHYVSRPPGRKAPQWVGISFAEKDKSKRHPYDPKLWVMRRSSRAGSQAPARPSDDAHLYER